MGEQHETGCERVVTAWEGPELASSAVKARLRWTPDRPDVVEITVVVPAGPTVVVPVAGLLEGTVDGACVWRQCVPAPPEGTGVRWLPDVPAEGEVPSSVLTGGVRIGSNAAITEIVDLTDPDGATVLRLVRWPVRMFLTRDLRAVGTRPRS